MGGGTDKKRCVIFGAGAAYGTYAAQRGDFVIAADGGFKTLKETGIIPALVVGDFDSLGYIPEHGNIRKLDKMKDVTDMREAVSAGEECGCGEFHIYGGCGGRLDHTLANIQLAAELSKKGKKAYLYGENCVVTAVTDGKIEFGADMKGYVSVFSHTDKAEGVYEEGLLYPLNDAALVNTFPLGVSNEFTGKASSVSVRNGTLLIIYSAPYAKF